MCLCKRNEERSQTEVRVEIIVLRRVVGCRCRGVVPACLSRAKIDDGYGRSAEETHDLAIAISETQGGMNV